MSDQSHQPLISVIMSVYNDERYLSEAVESIIAQTYKNFEFIIIDDSSTDNTQDILLRHSRKDTRIKIITNKNNEGLTKNLNKGLILAEGQFIARMDSDDIALPERFERQIELFQTDPGVVLCGCAILEMDENGKIISKGAGPKNQDVLKWYSIFRPGLAHPTAMFRANLIEQGLRYDEFFSTAQDYEFWSRIQTHGKAAILQTPLLKHRTHNQNISTLKKHEQAKNSSLICLSNLNLNFPGFLHITDESGFKPLADFIYLNDRLTNKDINYAINLLLQLQEKFISNLDRPNKHVKKSIKRLTVRWIIQALFTKRKSSVQQKLLVIIYLRTEFISLLEETVFFVTRRFIGKKYL